MLRSLLLGIEVYKSATIRGNDIHGNVNAIIVDERAEANLLGNSITNDIDGIQVYGKATIGGMSGEEGNTISGSRSLIPGNYDLGFGILVAKGGEATITHDSITGNDTGIRVGSSASDDSRVDAREDDLSGNAHAGVTSKQTGDVHIVDASRDWWGNLQGPTSTENPGGNGTSVSSDVQFRPWIVAYRNTASVGFDATGVKLSDKGQVR